MKNLTLKITGIVLLCLTITSSCSDGDCQPIWTVTKEQPEAIIEISETNKWLSMEVSGATKGKVAEVFQTNAAGKYEVYANFENFQSPTNGGGGYAELIIYSVTPADSILDTTSVAVGLDANNLYTSIATIDRTEKPYTQENGNRGIFHIEKTPAGVTLEVIYNEDTLKTFTPGSTSANILAFRMGCNAEYLPGVLGIKIDKIEFVKGESITLKEDNFTCNTFFPLENE